MTSIPSEPRLRLVGADPASLRQWSRERAAREAVSDANRAAADNPALDPADPRWVLAARTASQLQGSMLSPERRERVLRTANQLGIRPFDANVIIAITQDQARRGESLGEACGTLALVTRPDRRRHMRSALVRFVTAVVCAAVATMLLIRWIA